MRSRQRVAKKFVPLTPSQRQRVSENQGLVYECVRRYLYGHKWAYTLEADLIQAGLLGLCEAASRREPDPTLGTSWSTYAWTYIERWVREEARNTTNPVSTPQASGRGAVVVTRGVMPHPEPVEMYWDAVEAQDVAERMVQWVSDGRKRGKKPPSYTPAEAVDLFVRVRGADQAIAGIAEKRGVSRQTGRNMYLAADRAFRAVKEEVQAELASA